jgi:DNA-binding transcriptional regulator YiaG
MSELLQQMGVARLDREYLNKQLNRNTIQMQKLVAAALEAGLFAPTIAHHLGVTKRTIYKWSK